MSTVTVKIDRSKYKTEMSTRGHNLIADEPSPFGTDHGPTPYDYLLMALGSCTAMTVRMYADRKGWDLDDVEVNLTQSRVHADDCEACESTSGYVHSIEKEIRFVGNLDEKQLARLLDISKKCPVHRTLENEITISERMVKV